MTHHIQAIDIMNYPHYCDPEERRRVFFSYEWEKAFQTTFRSIGSPERALKAFGHPNLESMLKEAEEAGYEKIFIVAMKQWSYYNHNWVMHTSIERVKELVDQGQGKIVGAVSYNPFQIEESLREIDKAVKEYGFKYIYFHPQGFGLPPNDRRYYPLYAKALELDVPVGLQTGHSAEVMPSDPGRPIYIDEVAIEFPSVKFVLSHTGWPWVDEWIAMVWKHPNVYGDISAYPPRALPERDKLLEFIERRGQDKVLFGTNSLGLKLCKSQFMELPLSDEVKAKVLRENAVKLFKL